MRAIILIIIQSTYRIYSLYSLGTTLENASGHQPSRPLHPKVIMGESPMGTILENASGHLVMIAVALRERLYPKVVGECIPFGSDPR